MFCALLTSRYQVSVYRTNGPLVSDLFSVHQDSFCTISRAVASQKPSKLMCVSRKRYLLGYT